VQTGLIDIRELPSVYITFNETARINFRIIDTKLVEVRSVNPANDTPKVGLSIEIKEILHSLDHELCSLTDLGRPQKRSFVGKYTKWGPNCIVHGVCGQKPENQVNTAKLFWRALVLPPSFV